MTSENNSGLFGTFARRALAWLPALIWAGLIFFLSNQPKETYDRLGLTGQLFSVGGHLVAYAGLMALLVLAWRKSSELPPKRVYIIAFLLVALYGLSDEYHQSFVSGRTATVADWLVDLVGATLAWIAISRRY
jgi:VanZ family protein